MESWPLLKKVFDHSLGAVGTCGMYWLASHAIMAMFPSGPLNKYFAAIDVVLPIVTMTVLGVLFLNFLVRFLLDGLIAQWKGFPSGKAHILLA